MKEKRKEGSPLLSLVSSPAVSQQKGPDAGILYTEGQLCNTMPPLASLLPLAETHVPQPCSTPLNHLTRFLLPAYPIDQTPIPEKVRLA